LRGPAALATAVAAAVVLPVAAQFRVAHAVRTHSDRWRHVPVEPRGSTVLGMSFRPTQAEAYGLDPGATLLQLLARPFELIRLGAYWSRIEPAPGMFQTDELDWQIDSAERAGKRVILSVGAVKNFSYPEFFVPAHILRRPLPEGGLVDPDDHPAVASEAVEFVTRVVERYRNRAVLTAWQVEHEAADPLGVEHSWRLSERFVSQEVAAVRAADPSRPVMMNGFLPTSTPVQLQQWWRTRDQGDSLAVARRLADIVGVDYYPRHALAAAGPWTIYLDGDRRSHQRRLPRWADTPRLRLMVSEGQAEPWEAVTTPPNPQGGTMFSCPPDRVIENYNRCIRSARSRGGSFEAYLFWGAEYWVLRERSGDRSYLDAFDRIVSQD
jgi:hypothetical protein